MLPNQLQFLNANIRCSYMKKKTHFMAHQLRQHAFLSAQPHNEMPSQIRPPCQSQDSESDHKDETEPPSHQNLCVCDEEKMALPELVSDSAEESGREKLKRHRLEVAGRVWIPEIWGQEDLLKDWIDCSAFDAPLVPSRIMTARVAMVREGTRANAEGFIIENRY